MTLNEFHQSVAASTPPSDLNLALQALWWAAKTDWQAAHACVQRNEGDPACDWVHAYLHRLEGDAGNAAYWYQRAGRPVAAGTSDAEWTAIARDLLRLLDRPAK